MTQYGRDGGTKLNVAAAMWPRRSFNMAAIGFTMAATTRRPKAREKTFEIGGGRGRIIERNERKKQEEGLRGRTRESGRP